MKSVFVTLMLAAALSWASASAIEPQRSLTKILDQQRALQADLSAGKVGILTPRAVNTIRKAQKDVFVLTDGKMSLDQLSIDEKVKLENALERINAEVKGGGLLAKDEQEVCWREHKSGSQVKVTRCGTEAEQREAREGARAFMEKPKICNPPGCGA